MLITLQRSACYGDCPDYKVTIDGRGNVLFTTRQPPVDEVASLFREHARQKGVVVEGAHRAHVDPRRVMALLEQARSSDFFAHRSEFRARITDSPTYVVTIDTGHVAKTIVDYAGEKAGMPHAITKLEDAVDQVAGTERWINGTADVIPLLQAEHVAFAGPSGAALMEVAAARNDVAVMRRLDGLGAPKRPFAGYDPFSAAVAAGAQNAVRFLLANGGEPTRDAMLRALQLAIASNDRAMVNLLLENGGRVLIGAEEATRLLPVAAAAGTFELAQYLLNKGADVNGPTGSDPLHAMPLFNAVSAATGDGRTQSERRALVALLLRKGASLSPRKAVCGSILGVVDDPRIAHLLIAAGADPNSRDCDGVPLLSTIYNEDVALVLIAAGARLDAVNPTNKQSLGDWAAEQKWSRVLASLDAPRRGPSH